LYIHTGTYHWIGLTSKVNDFHWVHDKKKPIFVKFASGYPVKSGKYSYFAKKLQQSSYPIEKFEDTKGADRSRKLNVIQNNGQRRQSKKNIMIHI
jgi:hypothetical protein